MEGRDNANEDQGTKDIFHGADRARYSMTEDDKIAEQLE